MKTTTSRLVHLGLGALCALAMSVPAFAHHSQSEFDPSIPVDVAGTVSKVEWKSPHARLYIDVKDESGKTVQWNFELPSPNTLMRRGWKHNAIKPGDEVRVSGYRARNFPTIGIGKVIMNKAGEPMFAGLADQNN